MQSTNCPATIADLVADRLLATATAADLLATNVATHQEALPPEQLTDTAAVLAAGRVDPTQLARGLFAYVLVAAAGPRSGWSPEWRRLLVALRNHPAADVRQRALDLTTAQEI